MAKRLLARWGITRNVFAYATVLVAFFLRAYRLPDKNIWWDEGWSVWLSQHDLAWIALRTAADEHPPMHYWLLHFWNLVAGTEAFAGRFVSLFFGALTIALVYRIGKKVGGKWIGILAALFLATARFHIWWSQDIKNYTPSIFFAFAAVWFGLIQISDFRRQTSDSSKRYSPFATRYSLLGYATCAALAMWTHYLAALVLLALNLYWLIIILRSSFVVRRWSPGLAHWFIANLLAAALFAPWLYLYLQNAASWAAAPTFDFGLFIKLVATVLPLGVTTNIDHYAALTIAFTTLAMLGCVPQKAVGRKQEAMDTKHLPTADYLLLTLIVALPPLLVYALSLTPVAFFAPKIQARYLLVLLPAYAILLALGIATLKRFSIWLAAAATIFILGANIFVLNDYYAERRLTDEYATLTNTINTFARQGDVVLLETDQEWPTFLYYLRAPLDWIGVPNGKPMDAATADALVQRALNRNGAVWLVTIPDALATDPQKLVEQRLARELPKTLERTIDDKRLVSYASGARDWVAIPRENFAPQYTRADRVDANAQLIGFDLPARALNAGDSLRLVTYWHAESPAIVSVRVASLITTTLQMPRGDVLRYENDFAIPPTAVGDFALMVDQIELARISIAPRPEIARDVNISKRVDYRLGDAIHLVGYDLPITRYRAGDNVSLTLYWRAEKPVAKSFTVFVHLVGEQFNPRLNNPLWGQIDRVSSPPSAGWRVNEIVPDAYIVKIDTDAPAGKYRVEIGMYDAATGARLTTDSGDSIVIDEIEIR